MGKQAPRGFILIRNRTKYLQICLYVRIIALLEPFILGYSCASQASISLVCLILHNISTIILILFCIIMAYPCWDLLGEVWGLQFIPPHSKQCPGNGYDPKLCDAVRDSPLWFAWKFKQVLNPFLGQCPVQLTDVWGLSSRYPPPKCIPTSQLQKTIEICCKELTCCGEENSRMTKYVSNPYHL